MDAILKSFLLENSVHFPIDAHGLFRLIVANANGPSTLRLQDYPQFEAALRQLAQKWQYGIIHVADNYEENGPLIVLGAHVFQNDQRKRKRGEELPARSQTPLEQQNIRLPLAATMQGISNDDRTVLSLLSEGTAKQKLLAEQVFSLLATLVRLFNGFLSTLPRQGILSPFVPP